MAQEKSKHLFRYISQKEYDRKVKINGDEIEVYSKGKLEETNAGCAIAGETFEKRKRDKEKDLGTIELAEKKLYVAPYKTHSRLFRKEDAYIKTEDGNILVLLKFRLLLLWILLAIAAGGLCLGITLIGKNDKEQISEEVDSFIKPADTNLVTISGSVLKNDMGIGEAVVTLYKGNKEVAATTTDEQGRYLIAGMENGAYNLVVVYGESRLLKLAEVLGMSIVVDFYFPADDLHDVEEITGIHDPDLLPEAVENLSEAVQSNLTVQLEISNPDTPDIAVGGLDVETMLHMAVKKDVELTLEARQLEEDEVSSADKALIQEICGDLNVTYFDFTLRKELEKQKEYLKTSKTVLEIVFPYDSSHAIGTYVFRAHEGEALRFEQLENKPDGDFQDGTYYFSTDRVYIYTNSFSTYAIGSAQNDKQTRGSDTITYSDIATVNLVTGDVSMLYKHDADSTNDVRLELYLVDGENELLIAKSGTIPPGNELSNMTVLENVTLPSVGTYNGVMRMYVLNSESDTSTNVDIPLSVALTR